MFSVSVVIGQYFNIHTHIHLGFLAFLKDLELLQDNTWLEEQLLLFLWGVYSMVYGRLYPSVFVLHLAHFTLVTCLIWKESEFKASLSSGVHMPKVRQNFHKDPFACHQRNSE